MNRRDLLKFLPIASTIRLKWFGKEAGAGFNVDAKKVILFINENVIPARAFPKSMFKDLPAEVTVIPISVPEGKTIDDVIRIYDLGLH